MKMITPNLTMRSICYSIAIITAVALLSTDSLAQYPAGSPVAINGKLKVSGSKLVNKCGNTVQLRGMSSHGVHWFTQCYSNAALTALTNNWGIDVFRIAMYVQEGGYVNNPAQWKTWIDNMVDQCATRGIYCIIDWHILNPGDPNVNITEAREFWTYMSNKHKGKDHVLYEIANEPNGVSWSTIKTYANDIIPRIRANDATTTIIVGTPTWSQDVDVAANDPLTFTNLMYTLHFYSGTHGAGLRSKANVAISKGLALFVTEFGTSAADGNGGPFLSPQTDDWMTWMNTNKLSWCNWSFADKSETSAALAANACSTGAWTSTSTSGTYIKNKISSPADNFVCTTVTNFTITASAGTGGTINPAGSIVVGAGANRSFTITPGNGFVVNAVTVNGTSVGAVGTYTFTNVQANQTIVATFRQGTGTSFTITATAGTGGTISPSGSVSVAAGTSRSFTMAAGTGFVIDNVTVNGTSVGAVGTYNFTNVQSNQSIAATFMQQPTSTADVIGPDCGTRNTTLSFELNSSRRANATSYSWWYTASSQSISAVSGSPFRANLATGNSFSSGQVCVGINYNRSPWYASYCKTIAVCAGSSARFSETDFISSFTEESLSITPNPSSRGFIFTSSEEIRSFNVVNELGQTVHTEGTIPPNTAASFGENFKEGLYLLKAQSKTGQFKVKRIMKK